MTSEIQTDRYSKAAELELERDVRREPIWNEALIITEGDEAAAREHYIRLRVAQMQADEVEHASAEKARHERQLEKDEAALKPWHKSTLFLLGVLVTLTITLFWLFRH